MNKMTKTDTDEAKIIAKYICAGYVRGGMDADKCHYGIDLGDKIDVIGEWKRSEQVDYFIDKLWPYFLPIAGEVVKDLNKIIDTN